MGDDVAAFLEHHVETFNAAVASGDFGPLVELFSNDASLELAGVPVGPFEGHEAIAEAYGTIVEAFSWSADGGARSGEMRLTVDDGRIRRLVVVFG